MYRLFGVYDTKACRFGTIFPSTDVWSAMRWYAQFIARNPFGDHFILVNIANISSDFTYDLGEDVKCEFGVVQSCLSDGLEDAFKKMVEEVREHDKKNS